MLRGGGVQVIPDFSGSAPRQFLRIRQPFLRLNVKISLRVNPSGVRLAIRTLRWGKVRRNLQHLRDQGWKGMLEIRKFQNPRPSRVRLTLRRRRLITTSTGFLILKKVSRRA